MSHSIQKMQILILKLFEMDWVKKFNVDFWFLVIALAGFSVASALAYFFSFDNPRFFSIPYRILVLLFSIVVIIKNFKLNKLKNISFLSLVIFWIFYIIKLNFSLSHDFYQKDFLANANELYIRIFLIILLPSIALLFIDYRKCNLYKVAQYIYYVLLVMLTINLIYGVFSPHENFAFSFIFMMYYISYGHLGATLAIISFFFLIFNEQKIPKYLLLYSLALGIITIVVGTARSPILALIVVFLYILIVKRKVKLIFFYFLAFIAFLFSLFLYKKLDLHGVLFAERTYNWMFQGDNSLRTPLYTRAINIFKENIIFGNRVLYEDGSYPHDIFLELLMGTGIVGVIIYFTKFYPVLIKIRKIFNAKENLIYILYTSLFIQYFILVLTSFSIFSVPEFLYYSSIIIGINLNNYEKT